MDSTEARAVIKFLTLKGKNATETHAEMVCVYGQDTPSLRTVQRWAAEFSRGRKGLADDPRSGRPSTSTNEEKVAEVEDIVFADRRVRVVQIALELGISVGSVSTILHDHLGLSKVSARWVPRMLTLDNKRRRVECATELLSRWNADAGAFEQRLITGDETWLYHYDPETKQASMEWRRPNEPAPRKFKAQKSAVKVMGIFFWDSMGIVHLEYLPHGATVTGHYYAEVLDRLHIAVKNKRRGKLAAGILLLQDNAPAHTSQVAVNAATRNGFELLPHPAYSPDMAPSDFFLFKHLKKSLRGRRYTTDEELKSTVEAWCSAQSSEFFLDGFRDLPKRWEKCINRGGDYIEK